MDVTNISTLVILIAISTCHGGFMAECPKACDCKPMEAYVSCVVLNMTDVPMDIPHNTTKLLFVSTVMDTIGPEVFQSLTELAKIELSFYERVYIQPGIFRNLSNLESISFLSLRIPQMNSSEAFNNLICSIKSSRPLKLRMSKVLPAGHHLGSLTCLQGLHIELLEFNSNQVTFRPALFSGLSIMTLNLDNVFNGQFNISVFWNISNIYSLSLSNNQLTEFPAFEYEGARMLPDLEFLTLDSNLITTLKSSDIHWIPKLKTLHLRHSQVVLAIDAMALSPPVELNLLDLSDTVFKQTGSTVHRCLFANSTVSTLLLNSTSFDTSLTFKCSPNLTELDLSDNRVYFLPRSFAEQNLRVTVDSTYMDTFHNVSSLIRLNLSKNRIFAFANNKPVFAGLFNLQVLDLSKNLISYWPPTLLEDLTSLKVLNLAFNQFWTIDQRLFPTPGYIFGLETINILYNPISCSCDLYWFTTVIHNSNLGLEPSGILKATCVSKDTDIDIRTYQPTLSECQPLPVEYKITAILTITLAVSVLFFSFIYRYRWHVRFFMFQTKAKFAERQKFCEDEMDIYKYDAFVSYNSRDVLWVRDSLLPIVEGEMECSVCLHDRDWLAGIDIVDNISSSVLTSRKVILVISNAFARSQWCQLELTMAQHHLLEQDRNSLILIMLEDIESFNMTPRLALQMKTQTYIEWTDDDAGQKLFHGKMKKALGRKQGSIRMQSMRTPLL